MLTTIELQTLRKKLEDYEGSVEHMYLDSKGLVTVGVGHLLATLQEAQKLPFTTQARVKATAVEIQADYDAVKKQPANRLAIFYKRFTKLKLNKIEIDKLTNKHIDSFYRELKQLYSGYDAFPSEAKLALMDLIFNLGATNLRTKWPNLNKAVKASDWANAALNSNRKPPVSAARNTYVKDLFNKAETVKQAKLKTSRP